MTKKEAYYSVWIQSKLPGKGWHDEAWTVNEVRAKHYLEECKKRTKGQDIEWRIKPCTSQD